MPQLHRGGSLKSRTICKSLIKFLSLEIFPIVVVASGWKLLLFLSVRWRIFQPLTYHRYVLLLFQFLSVHQEEGSTPYGLNFLLRFLLLPLRLKGRFPFTFAPLEDIYRMLSCKRYFSCNRRRSNFLSQWWIETCACLYFIRWNKRKRCVC